MKNVKVLGTGCANCRATVQRIETAARELGVDVDIEKVEDVRAILGYDVMATPAVVVDGRVVHAGGIPGREQIAAWLRAGCCEPAEAAATRPCCGG
ncbi:MAG TPA: thioredoxin family protein [Casimicrobiaceae bacterium]|nr:thioredoxin family protein [Casimicrobiaceae bacterium]